MTAASWGFFPVPGKDYAKGAEPIIASRLDALGRALRLHLLGLSGYRTPAHSVAVGGFANDPHTRGEASDTPGIEQVPEEVLNRFGLTRPFAGAKEANHIQLLPGWRGIPSQMEQAVRFAQRQFQGSGIPLIDPLVDAFNSTKDAVNTAGEAAGAVGSGISWLSANWEQALLSAVLVAGGMGLTLYGAWLFFRPTTTTGGGPDGSA